MIACDTSGDSGRDRAESGPFDLGAQGVYQAWRSRKLAAYPTDAADLKVEIARLAAPSAEEIRAVRDRCRAANMAIYSGPENSEVDRDAIRDFAATFGLRRLDRHLLADESGITALSPAAEGRRRDYIPYSNRGLSWHTDGYYNEASRRIRAVILHCAHAAASGGENALLDPEIAYIHLRDADPAYIAALMHPQAMTIPANREGGVEIRPAVSGPVFSVDGESGALHMRFSARARNIAWHSDSATDAARACLEALLADPRGPVIRCRLGPGQGIIGNNVLHDRTAFRDGETGDGETGQRLVYRARFFDRIAGTEPREAG
jgi:alpha-ketoglutarate-dependent taurine dioxygenase